MLGGLNAFFLLVDRPEVYGLPPDPKMPTRNLVPSSLWSVLGARGGRPSWASSVSAIARQPARTLMPSTLFTAPPDWRWLIVVYFFLGGIAGGAYFLAALIDLFGRPTDRPLARLGYFDRASRGRRVRRAAHRRSRRPERFWHMLIQVEDAAARC